MAIYLDDTIKEDELLIKAIEQSDIVPWIKKSLIGKIESDQQRKERIKNCKHETGEYTGKKTCCKFCGGYEPGQGEEWTLNTDLNNLEGKGTGLPTS